MTFSLFYNEKRGLVIVAALLHNQNSLFYKLPYPAMHKDYLL